MVLSIIPNERVGCYTKGMHDMHYYKKHMNFLGVLGVKIDK